MGKVFDALEKSNQKISIEPLASDERKNQDRDDSAQVEGRSQSNTARFDKSLVTILEPHSFESEQFKILRANILFPTSGKPPRMIMVTSAVPGEGKSFVASNLAISIAQNIDEHVLLMDCDLRLPSIHNRFHFESKTGLSDYLTGDVPLSSLLVKVGVDKLSILPGGKPPANPAELLSSEKMTQLLEEVKLRYEDRYIIIDSAPPQLTAESSALARQVDGIVLVINYGKTKRELISDLIEILGKEKIIGIVFNRFNLRSSTYYGYGKYSHYGKYYGTK
ncbi:MAG: polysaccharide biosynthesis tyrosine autokinase [Desulfobacteraceae bacterium]|nr:MAG: polysaccharide biosynthesis tyrosine autokinase [Desulfobacteraceae bacterium]